MARSSTTQRGQDERCDRGIEANLGPGWGDSFHDDLHPDLKADYLLANPPFNIPDWGRVNSCATILAGNAVLRPLAMPTTHGFST